ncbi:hypothetical protein AVEN_150670-1 [Araneus ventricosus]|uniref:Mos1 transposase HTH domain-containing protein n=1 Tax=Araneus ventricosus TaxID=182803 RepID=A0A4Y2P8U8_ARAVE|nr:hypothetical protein AVEN_150670-1 [Araneus ventricosus]
MAMKLDDCTVEEQRAVALFFWVKGLESKNIHKEMSPVYGEKCLSRKAVYNCEEKFSQGRGEIRDEHRSVRPVLIATKSTEQQVEDLIRANRRVTSTASVTVQVKSTASTLQPRLSPKRFSSVWSAKTTYWMQAL